MNVEFIQSFRGDFEVLGSLREGERLQTNGRTFSKLQAPDRFLKNREHPLLKLLHKIITLVLKIFQALERQIREEGSDFNLYKVEELTRELSETLDEDLPSEQGNELYAVLQHLGHVYKDLNKSVGSSLNCYKETLLTRRACLDASLAIDEPLRADRIEQITDDISRTILPKLGHVIETLESRVFQEDCTQSEAFLDRLFGRYPLAFGSVVSAKAYIHVLEGKYGRSAVDRALSYYKLEHERTLTGADMTALAIGVVANITEEDLRVQTPDFDRLSEDQLCKRLIKIRSSISYSALAPEKSLPYYRQLEHDQNLLQYVNEISDWTAETDEIKVKGLKRYSYAEYLSRHIAYGLFNKNKTRFPDGLLIPMYDETNTLRLLSTHQIISVKGLHGALFKPLRSVNGPNKVHVVFRGSYCKYSLLRDISPTERMHSRLFDGPGRYSFIKQQERIYDKIMELTSSTSQPVFEFGGHSLGGSDAMRAMEYFIHRQSESSERLPVVKFVLNAFNTPGVEPDVNRRFMESLKKLEIETDLRYFDVHHDIIQELGSVRLGYWRNHETCPDHLRVSIFKFNRRIEERLAALARNFFRRMRFSLEKALEAHTFYCLRLHDTDIAEKLNSTFIQDILTNHQDDIGVSYGQELNQVSEITPENELSDRLLTASCLVGRKLNRMSRKAAAAISRVFTVCHSPEATAA